MRGATMRSTGNTRALTNGAAAMPRTKAMRQPTSPVRGDSRPARMPLMPKIRPLNKINTAQASPSKMPPPSDSQGVKWIQSIVIEAFMFAVHLLKFY